MEARSTRSNSVKETKAQVRFRGCDYDLYCLSNEESLEINTLLQSNNKEKLLNRLERNILYVKKESNGLSYIVISPLKEIETGVIPAEDLRQPIVEPLDLNELQPLLLDILTITSHRGHTSQIENNLDFVTWYNSTTLERLVYLLPESTDKSQLKPYLFFDDTSVSNIDLLINQLGLLKSRLMKSNAIIQTFITKPEIGAAHFYGGIIFKDNNNNFSLVLFNPVGNYKKIQTSLKELEAKKIFNKIYLSINTVQSDHKDEGKLVSCGPISGEFVKHIHAISSTWIKLLTNIQSTDTIINIDLTQFEMLPDHLIKLIDATPLEYKTTMLEIRRNHYYDLSKITTQEDFNNASEIEILGFDDKEPSEMTFTTSLDDLMAMEEDELSDTEEDSDKEFEFPDEQFQFEEENHSKETNQKNEIDKQTTLHTLQILQKQQKDFAKQQAAALAMRSEIEINNPNESDLNLSTIIDDLQRECDSYRRWIIATQAQINPNTQKANDLQNIRNKVTDLQTILDSTENDKIKLTKFSKQFADNKKYFLRDNSHPAIKFVKSVARLLAVIFSFNYYSSYRKKELGLTRQSSHFWKSDMQLRGGEFIKGVKAQSHNFQDKERAPGKQGKH